MSLNDEIANRTARETVIEFPDGEYESINSGIYSGSVSLEEILCSSRNFKVGECNASKFSATIANISVISNTKIHVYQNIGDYTADIFTGYIDSAKLVANRSYREIVAYDALYYKADTNIAGWYNSLFTTTSIVTVKQMRDSLFEFIGLSQEATTLINDNITLTKTVDSNSIRFDDMLKLICEINACFGHINPAGNFEYIYLSDAETIDITTKYRKGNSTHEEYQVKNINKLIVYDDDLELAVIGTGSNLYTIKDNFLISGMDASAAFEMASNIYAEICTIKYTPSEIEMIFSDPTIRIGDKVKCTNTIFAYVLKNTLKGIQMFEQSIAAAGDEYRDEAETKDVATQITALKTKIQNLKDADATVYHLNIVADSECATTSSATSVVLRAKVTDVSGNDRTEEYPSTFFHWLRQSEDTSGDTTFNSLDKTGYSITVEHDENLALATYICTVDIDANGSSGNYVNSGASTNRTLYNVIYDETMESYVGGTDLRETDYGIYETYDITSSWDGSGLYGVENMDGYRVKVRKLGGYVAGFTVNNKALSYWGTTEDALEDTGVYIVDYLYANSTVYRLSYTISDNVKTYAIHSMSNPATAQSLIYSTTDKITAWTTDGTNHLIVVNNIIYKVTNTTTRISLTNILAYTGINKLYFMTGYFVCIANKGKLIYCTTSNLTTWTTVTLGSQNLIDICDVRDNMYIINSSGTIFKGVTSYEVFDTFAKNPLSLNICDKYMIATYLNNIKYKDIKRVFWNTLNSLDPQHVSGLAVVYNGEMYRLGGYALSTRTFKKYYESEDSWSSVGNLPSDFRSSSAACYVHENEIHLLGGYGSVSAGWSGLQHHYTWNGQTWTNKGETPHPVSRYNTFYYNNKIYMQSNYDIVTIDGIKHLIFMYWDNETNTWITDNNLTFVDNNEVVTGYTNSTNYFINNGKLYVLFYYYTTGIALYVYQDNSWTEVDFETDEDITLISEFASCEKENYTYMVINTVNNLSNCYRFNGRVFEKLPSPEYNVSGSPVINFSNRIHIIGGQNNPGCYQHYVLDEEWLL